MSDTLYISLDYLDWSVCVGGRHYTGHLTFSDRRERVELERDLSLREAKDLRPDHSEHVYDDPYFRRTNRFDSFEDLSRAAVKWCESNLTGIWLLKKGDTYGVNPVLGAGGVSPVRVRMLNLIAEQSDRSYVWRGGFGHMDRDMIDGFHRAYKAWEPT